MCMEFEMFNFGDSKSAKGSKCVNHFSGDHPDIPVDVFDKLVDLANFKGLPLDDVLEGYKKSESYREDLQSVDVLDGEERFYSSTLVLESKPAAQENDGSKSETYKEDLQFFNVPDGKEIFSSPTPDLMNNPDAQENSESKSGGVGIF